MPTQTIDDKDLRVLHGLAGKLRMSDVREELADPHSLITPKGARLTEGEAEEILREMFPDDEQHIKETMAQFREYKALAAQRDELTARIDAIKVPKIGTRDYGLAVGEFLLRNIVAGLGLAGTAFCVYSIIRNSADFSQQWETMEPYINGADHCSKGLAFYTHKLSELVHHYTECVGINVNELIKQQGDCTASPDIANMCELAGDARTAVESGIKDYAQKNYTQNVVGAVARMKSYWTGIIITYENSQVLTGIVGIVSCIAGLVVNNALNPKDPNDDTNENADENSGDSNEKTGTSKKYEITRKKYLRKQALAERKPLLEQRDKLTAKISEYESLG